MAIKSANAATLFDHVLKVALNTVIIFRTRACQTENMTWHAIVVRLICHLAWVISIRTYIVTCFIQIWKLRIASLTRYWVACALTTGLVAFQTFVLSNIFKVANRAVHKASGVLLQPKRLKWWNCLAALALSYQCSRAGLTELLTRFA